MKITNNQRKHGGQVENRRAATSRRNLLFCQNMCGQLPSLPPRHLRHCSDFIQIIRNTFCVIFKIRYLNFNYEIPRTLEIAKTMHIFVNPLLSQYNSPSKLNIFFSNIWMKLPRSCFADSHVQVTCTFLIHTLFR